MTCTCPEVHLNAGDYESVGRNWNPDCSEHGTASAWYGSTEQVDARAYQNRKLRRLQKLASFRRRTQWRSQAPDA